MVLKFVVLWPHQCIALQPYIGRQLATRQLVNLQVGHKGSGLRAEQQVWGLWFRAEMGLGFRAA